MKFGSIAILVLTLVAFRPSPAAENCPLDNAFMSGIKTGTINPNRMESIAGLAASRKTPGVLWAHNSGSINRIFALETGSKSLDDFTLSRNLIDVQDIAIGAGDLIYLGDIGGVRQTVVIARFAEPTPPRLGGILPLAAQEFFTIKYPDGSHDARGLMIDPLNNDVFVVTFEAAGARVYQISPQTLLDPNGVMTFVANLPLGSITAADISANGSKILMRNVSEGWMWIRKPAQTIAQAFASAPVSIPMLDGFENNGNSLAIAHDGSGYYTTGQGPDPALYFFARNTSPFTTGAGLATITEATITEISGVAASRRNPGLLWMHNDGAPYYTYLASTNGSVVATYQFATAIDDYEDIAVGPGPVAGVQYVYGGDIGDNLLIRGEVRIFRFPEPRVTQTIPGISAAGETVITLLYPDGVHDAEALMVDPITGDLFVVTKEANAFRVYKATQAQLNSGAVETLTLVQGGSFGPVSGGDISPDGTMIVLRHEREARLWGRRAGESIEAALGRASERIPVIGEPIEGNGEGITFALDSRGYYTMSEGILPTIYFFDHLAEPRFIGPPQITQNTVRVTVSGCDGSSIRLEGSNELTAWARVGSGFVENGIATIDSSGGAPLRFFRAVVEGP
ncbi:MAG TPA: hypothetical protein VM680_04110 [Verrucomicrobiae bacterium]|nr:hypothetical protein [Verrucomicrobiae bacterium]